MKKPLINLVELILKNNEISFDNKELIFQIQSHPSYPSLHSVTGVLDHFNIQNIAVEVPVNSETLVELPESFIAEINTKKGNELVAVVKKQMIYNLVFDSKEQEFISESEFLERFTGIVVVVEKTIKDSVNKFNSSFFLKIISLVVISLMLIIVFKPTIILLIFFFFSFLGLTISISIYKNEIGLDSKIGDAFCGISKQKKNCDAVLSSKGAKVIGTYKLSDFSLIFFFWLVLLSFSSILNIFSLDIGYLVCLIVLPVTIFSIFYQIKVLKKWCSLCLSISFVLWVLAILAMYETNFKFAITRETIFLTSATLLIIILIWDFLKPKLKEYQKNKEFKIDYFRFKRKYKLFSALLKSALKIDTKISDLKEISLGNKDASLEIILVTNPRCFFCKEAHAKLFKILESNNDNIHLIIRFNVNTLDNNISNKSLLISDTLIEIFNNNINSVFNEAINEIYAEKRSSKKWIEKWSLISTLSNIDVLSKQREWCLQNKINFTPSILINGYQFPKEYKISDLHFFIEDLIEEGC